MRVALTIAFLFALTKPAECADKGFCPPPAPFPKLQKPTEPPPRPDHTYVGTVSLAAVVSDKGYVCSARVLQGIDNKINAEALAQVKAWRFDPARKDGRAIPVSIQVDVAYWRDKDGRIISLPTNPPEEQKVRAKPN
jgi:TonB family protein